MKAAEVTAKKVEFARLLTLGLTILEAGRAVGVGATSSRRWAALVRSGGVERLVMATSGRQPVVPFAVKWQAVKAVNAGHSQTSVMEALRLPSETSIGNWRRAVAEYGAAGIGGTESAAAAADLLPMPRFRAPANVRHSEEARQVFAAVVAAGGGYETASRQAGVPMSTAWAWYHRLRRGESISLAAVAPAKSYTAELKLAAARAVVDNGMTRAEALAYFGVRSHASLGAWMQAYRRHGSEAFTPVAPAPATRSSPSDDLFAQLDPSLPVDVKVQMVTDLAGKHPVRALLRAVKLSPSTYYYRRARPPKADRYAQVRPLLRGSFETAYRAYGYRRLRQELRRKHGVYISGKTMRRLMREEGCRCLVRRRKPRTTRPDAPENVFAPNLLKRDWSTTATAQKWVTDVTQFSINGQLLFLSPLIDLHSRRVISYQLDTNQNMPMVLGMLTAALKQAQRGVTVVHSDRGWQYQHHAFRNLLRDHGIAQSMSRSGNCYDNAIAENFFSHFKQEFLRGRRWLDLRSFATDCAAYIRWYNEDRIGPARQAFKQL